MDTSVREIADGDEAARILDNPVYKNAVLKVREGLIRACMDSALGDEKTHNRLVIALQLLGQIEKNIKEVAVTGKLAKIQLEQTPVQKIRKAVGY